MDAEVAKSQRDRDTERSIPVPMLRPDHTVNWNSDVHGVSVKQLIRLLGKTASACCVDSKVFSS